MNEEGYSLLDTPHPTTKMPLDPKSLNFSLQLHGLTNQCSALCYRCGREAGLSLGRPSLHWEGLGR